MPKTRINCPNCRQPITADIEQLFDVNVDPTAKQRLLSGTYNVIQCPLCGYQGALATPIVYHDPQKELLLTFFPPELNMPRDEQERLIGSMINQVLTRLPQEQRKGYLLRPQAVLTMQGLAERILEADGITKEMLQAQQQRLNLLQRLMTVSDDSVLGEIVKQEDNLIDGDFFNLLGRLIEAAAAGGDQEGASKLMDLQKKLIPRTTFGHQLQEQTKEVESAVRSLQEAGRELTREKLLELVIQAPNETRLRALVSLARQGMDYQFFQLLSERIDRARSAGRERLVELRKRLLELTGDFDKQVEARTIQAKKLLDTIIQAKDISEATQQYLHEIDEIFIQVLNGDVALARKNGDLEKLEKLQKIVNIIQQASAPPREIALIEELLDAPDEQARRNWLEAHREEITPEFIDTITGLLSQMQANEEDEELITRLQAAYRSALRFSMQENMR